MRRLVSAALALALVPGLASAEVCRFSGTTSRGGQIGARVETAESGGLLTIDVTVSFALSTWLADAQYLGEEISTWRGGELLRLGVNQRTVVNGSIKRQQWDVFERKGGRLEAYRVQAKRLADFQQRHPGFAGHWALASFGQPWLPDYAAAHPERRPDLDLPGPVRNLRPPLALAFYWSRFLPQAGAAAAVFLPGFKRDARTELAFGPGVPGQGWTQWHARLRHPKLDSSPPSLAAAWVSPNNYLLQLGLDVHAPLASGQALIRTQGCEGVQIRPE